MIDINLLSLKVEIGSKFSGRFSWNPEQNQTSKAAIVSIGWRTEGRGSIDRKTVAEFHIPNESDRAIISHPFEFQIPFDSPISYDGRLLRIIWEVTVLVKHASWFPSREQHSVGFRVLPRQAFR